MATVTSDRDGRWTLNGTWDIGEPQAGDVVQINHAITLDDPSEIVGNVNINDGGSLTIENTGDLNVSGIVYVDGGSTGSTLEMEAGSKLQFYDSSSKYSGLWIENNQNANFIANGTNNFVETTLSATASRGDAYLAVSSTTGFAKGEYIAVKTSNDVHIRGDRSDECFIITHVDSVNNRLYIRRWVGSIDTANGTTSNSTSLVVDNAKAWRKGFRITFDGSGLASSPIEITAVNRNTNTLTLSRAISVSDGITIYETGVQKQHASGNVVRKLATIVSSNASASQNQLTVADASWFSVGDRIRVEYYRENSTTYGKQYNEQMEIQSISGNTLTMTTNFAYDHDANSVVVNMERDVKIQSGDSDQKIFVYSEYYTGNYTKVFQMRHVQCRDLGKTNSTQYRGFVLRGYHRRDTNTYESSRYGCFLEGNSWEFTTYNDWAGVFLNSANHNSEVRYNVIGGLHNCGIAPYWTYYVHVVGNFIMGGDYWGQRLEGIISGNNLTADESGSHYNTQYEYQFITNIDTYGIRMYNIYDKNSVFRYYIVRQTLYPVNFPTNRHVGMNTYYRFKFENCAYTPRPHDGGATYDIFVDSFVIPENNTSQEQGSDYDNHLRSRWRIRMINFNNEEGRVVEYGQVQRMEYLDDNSIKVMVAGDNYDYESAFEPYQLYVPSDSSVTMSMWVKKESSFDAGYFYLGATNSSNPWVLDDMQDAGLRFVEVNKYSQLVTDKWVKISNTFTTYDSGMLTFYWRGRSNRGDVFYYRPPEFEVDEIRQHKKFKSNTGESVIRKPAGTTKIRFHGVKL
jgi:hypothetical protein